MPNPASNNHIDPFESFDDLDDEFVTDFKPQATPAPASR